MFRYKKIINSDLLQLALIVSLLRLDLDMYLDGRWENRFEAPDVFLGTNLAYSPTQYHHLHHSYDGYVHPKSIDSMYDRFSIFAELNSLGRYDRFPSWSNDIFAYLVDQEQVQNSQQSLPNGSADSPESANVHNEEQEITRNEAVESESNTESQIDSQFMTSSNSELSFEDMNLIEILWKQDIDLGITKDAFDSRVGGEVSKTKQTENSIKTEKEPSKESQVPPPFDPWEGVDYTIDGETGEHIVLENSVNQSLDSTNPENCTFNDLDLQQLAEELQHIPLDEALLLFNDKKLDNVSEETLPKNISEFEPTFSQLRYENFSSDINMTLDSNNDCFINQMQDLDSLLNKTMEDSNNNLNQISDGCLPVTGESWQNFTSSLPLQSNNSNNQNQFSEQMRNNINIPESNRMLANISNINSNFSDLFPSVLLQNATLGSYSYPFQETERGLVQDTAISSSSALSNHSDPMAENMMNITYNASFPEFFCPNNATLPDFLENLMLDEDLQLMEMSCDEDDTGKPIVKQIEDLAETSDSAVSSMDSDKSSDGEFADSSSELSSIHNENFGTESFSFKSNTKNNSSDRHPPIAQKKYKYFGKKSLNFNEKNENDDNDYGKEEKNIDSRKHDSSERHNTYFNSGISENIANEQFDKFFQYQNIGTFKNFEENIRHNHTYNLPSEAANTKQKPVIRDKDYYSDEASRDERRARLLKIPISNEDIIHLPIDEFNERLSKYDLKEEQLTLIKDIRRRGKNKVAAQNCRKRKIGQIINLQEELQSLLEEKANLQAEQEIMLSYRRLVKDKYNQLYNLIAQSTSSNPQPSGPPNFFCQLTLNERDRNMSIPSNTSSLNIDSDVDSSKGARSKRKMNRK